ncbi:MAG TPA: hypothetical protein PKD74_00805 [Candidatus Dependentiae bacterium]|nr:hypothetical protein [Candidatus Dependentiae bacterium]
MVQKIFITLGLCLGFTLYGAQEFGYIEEDTAGPCLTIINATSWPASVYWNAQGKEYNTIIDAHSRETLGIIAEIDLLEIGTYGQVWGSLFSKHLLPLDTIKEDSAGRDIQIIIQQKTWSCSWSFMTRFCQKLHKCERLLPSDPWSAFPGVIRAQCMKRPVMPHHILNVDPSRISKQMAINCYKRLIALWDPEKFPRDTERIAQSICSILHQAHLDLHRELIEDPRHTEQTVYQT